MDQQDKLGTVFISGPMTGYPNKNIPAFEEAAEYLRKRGYTVKVPHEVAAEAGLDEETSSYDELLNSCLEAMQDCEGIMMLDGWSMSKGARRELMEAQFLDLHIYFLKKDPWDLLYMGKGTIL